MLKLWIVAFLLLLTLPLALAGQAPWRGLHMMIGSEADLDALGAVVPGLAKDGLNVLVVEVDYNYQFKSRPEMAKPDGVTFAGARALAKTCKSYGIQVIPQINCLGHQSWAQDTDTLLRVHPELDETPGRYPNNQGIYCRSWCPLNPELPSVILPLVDELIDAFQAKAFHVGMDEVFIIGDDACPLCHGKSKAELFAYQVKMFHDHFRKKRIQMLMWSDRFLDGKATGYGEWEASENGTDKAIDLVPKDIIMCDWHYDKRDDYPSIKIFADHGFRVWPSTWKDPAAATAFSSEGRNSNDSHVVGVLCTTWGEVTAEQLPTWPALLAAFAPWK